jgi:nucleotide-binding universal stress UspA family protein
MRKPIVVPLDGSPRAEHALVPVVALARLINCDVHLLHVRAEAAAGMTDVLDAYLQAIAYRIEDEYGGGRVITAQRVGPVAKSIVQYARQVNAALIVMGTRHQDGLQQSVVASVADRVARRAGMPVMLTGLETTPVQRGEQWTCRRILVPLDGSERAQQIVAPVTALAAAFRARITLLRVIPVVALDIGYPSVPLGAPLEAIAMQQDAMAQLERIAQRLRAQGVNADTRVVRTVAPVAQAITNEAIDTHADLIAIATRGHGMARRFAYGSVAHELVKRGDFPLLILSPREAGEHSSVREHAAAVEVPHATV